MLHMPVFDSHSEEGSVRSYDHKALKPTPKVSDLQPGLVAAIENLTQVGVSPHASRVV